jgi:hypothetical protein
MMLQTRYLEWIKGKAKETKSDCYIVFNVQNGSDSDQPPAGNDQPGRFAQFWISTGTFYMELPNTTITTAEAEVLLRDKPKFFFVSTRQKSEDPEASVNEFNPLHREYVYGEEKLAAEEMAYVLFDLWKLPLDLSFKVEGGRPGP